MKSWTVSTKLGNIRSIIHEPRGQNIKRGTILVAGAGGGVYGPSAIYEELATNLAAKGITAVRMDYRKANDLKHCVYDVSETLKAMKNDYQIEKCTIVGWSFGGAVALQACAKEDDIIGAATVASQTYGATEPAQQLQNKKSVLFIHGTGDSCLSDRCSKQLHALVPSNVKKELLLYKNDNHGCTNHHEEMLDKLTTWHLDTLVDQ
jgi:dienelactone hydrolase